MVKLKPMERFAVWFGIIGGGVITFLMMAQGEFTLDFLLLGLGSSNLLWINAICRTIRSKEKS